MVFILTFSHSNFHLVSPHCFENVFLDHRLKREFDCDFRLLSSAIVADAPNGSLVDTIEPSLWETCGITRAGHKILLAKAIHKLASKSNEKWFEIWGFTDSLELSRRVRHLAEAFLPLKMWTRALTETKGITCYEHLLIKGSVRLLQLKVSDFELEVNQADFLFGARVISFGNSPDSPSQANSS